MARSTASRTRRIAIAIVTAALTASGLVVVSATAASASDGAMFSQVNASRSHQGLPAYEWNSHLAAVAAGQAQRMADKRELYHNPNLASDVGNYRWVGENVGYGPNSDLIETAFMNSTPHRHNILDADYTQIGIASARDSKGRLWVAQVFREPTGGGSSGSSSGAATTAHKHKTTTSSRTATTAPQTGMTTHSSNAASTPTPTATRAATPTTPKPKRTLAVPSPAPQPTLAQRVSYATQQGASATGDPLADALAFAATMNAVGG